MSTLSPSFFSLDLHPPPTTLPGSHLLFQMTSKNSVSRAGQVQIKKPQK